MAKEDPSQETNIVWNEGQALPNDVMQTLADNPNISLTFNYIYKNESYSIYIPADKAVVTDDPWYGPEWLIGTYGNRTLTENSGQYRVKKGDTLGRIAASLGIKLSNLLQKNPQIKNPDKISVNQIIYY